MSVYANEGSSSGGSVYAQKGTTSGSVYAGGNAAAAAPKKKSGGGFLHSLGRYSGAEFVGNLGKDVGQAAVGFGPGIYRAGRALGTDLANEVKHPHQAGQHTPFGGKKSAFTKDVIKPTVQQYKDYYGHDLAWHLYKHPLQAVLDALTVADLGSTAAARAGLVDAGRAELVTRSPRAIATGEGPTHVELSSAKPLVRGREQAAARVRSLRPEGVKGVGGELKRYGKQIQAQATQHALGHLTDYQPYLKATKGLSQREWAALHIRAMDIHPADLQELWQGTPAEKWLHDPKVQRLVVNPTKKLANAENAARALSASGEKLLKGQGALKDETAAARPDLTKRQASEVLGRDVQQIHGNPYYLPHTLDEPAKPVNPLGATGGGKGVPKRLGSTKQNLGVLALKGKMHLRSDVLGPEFLRRVKYVKYDEIHNALVRGAVRVTGKQLAENYGGKLPKGWEFVRTKPGQRIPATLKVEDTAHTPIEKLVPNPDDLHDSALSEGFSTTDPAQAHTTNGAYFVVPKQMVKAATGEFTRSSDFTRRFISKPLSVWRAAVLGLRPGFLTNNLVGNSIMYAAKTGGHGALRDLFQAIRESRGDKVAKQLLDSDVTPPALRKSLYEEFFPEQVHGTFGRTQSPSTSTVGEAASKGARAFRATTGAIPRLTNAVAETGFRKALVRHYIRTSPEFKQVYRQLPKQTRSFETAARKLLESKGPVDGEAYQRLISRQVNQALGDYLHMTPAERNVLRNTLPFYAWYRAIATTTAHLAADTPLRANIISQLGQIGKEWSDEQLGEIPSFLEGSIPLGAGPQGTERVLTTQGLNPYATLEQLRAGTTGDLSELGLNPFLQGALDAYAKASEHGGKLSPGQLVGTTLQGMLAGLPASRVIAPQPPSKLYPTRNRKSTTYGFFGVPIKEYNRAVAAQDKRQGR